MGLAISSKFGGSKYAIGNAPGPKAAGAKLLGHQVGTQGTAKPQRAYTASDKSGNNGKLAVGCKTGRQKP